jgi:hypothetical protein
MTFPEDVHDISAPWLAAIFGVEAERIGDIRIEPSGEGVGFTSKVSFLSTQGTADGALPERIVVKQVADYDPETQSGLILLEDCSRYSMRSQVEAVPTTLEELGALIDVLASFNRVADAPSLVGRPWLFKPGNPGFDHFFRMIGDNWSTFLDSPFRDFLHAECVSMYERLASLYTQTVFDRWPKDRLGLSHFDFRIDNVFFDEDAVDPIIIFDWQAVGLGRGPMDLAYLLGGSYSIEFRRKHENWALERYCAALAAHGRQDCSLEDQGGGDLLNELARA